ncbi:MAG: deoxynucleoside kinase [Gammaproteobacteria bacterium]|nr:deoxynucleoside kinase [Gammaproteobacteria bacterium]
MPDIDQTPAPAGDQNPAPDRGARGPRGPRAVAGNKTAADSAGKTVAAAADKKYIVVEGPIGVGKTTLARRLAARMGAGLTLEQAADNPFLERFYKAPSQFALQTQLFFLFQRVRQLKKLRQGDLFSPLRVADFMLAKDPLFARLTLDEDELQLYEQVYRHLVTEVPRPDLVIYLQAPTDVLVARIRKRGVLFERSMERGYLEDLVEAYARYFLNYNASALLMVNAETLNFVDDDASIDMLLQQAENAASGRHYFNPVL